MKLKNKIAFASTITSIVVCSFQQVDLGMYENVDTENNSVMYSEITNPQFNYYNNFSNECSTFDENDGYLINDDTIVLENNSHNIEMSEVEQLFGELRQLTPEELIEQKNTMEKISEKTGVNFFDLC
ncbi:MAG: hypothetical protein PUG66_08005 [Clostridiales bacterium]|nr:hypothetical protein [Clostridiales bacterium]